jgi:hypothetical protein
LLWPGNDGAFSSMVNETGEEMAAKLRARALLV